MRNRIIGYLLTAVLVTSPTVASAVTFTNGTEEDVALTITENGRRELVVIEASETYEGCFDGCFYKMSDDEVGVLEGMEAVLLRGGHVEVVP